MIAGFNLTIRMEPLIKENQSHKRHF